MYQDPESVLEDVRPARARRAALDGVLGGSTPVQGELPLNEAQPQHTTQTAPSVGARPSSASQAPSAGAGQTAADRALQGAIAGSANAAPQGSQQPTGPDQSAWNTDGYAKPGYTSAGAAGALPGYDAAKWADPNHQTPKYVVGRILSSHDNKTPEGRAAAIADLQKAYPGTTFNGKDKVNIPGVGNNIDIYQGAGAGAFNPQWLTEENQGGGIGVPGGGPNAFDGFVSQNRGMEDIASRNTQTGGDALQAIYQMLPGLFGDVGVNADMNAIQSRNQQTGGDALQGIYQLLPGLMGGV